jgi:tetratricopeptide (TPR) repeat protein
MKKSIFYLYFKTTFFGVHRFATIFFILLLIAIAGHTQSKEKEDTTYVNTLLTQSKSLFGENPSKAIDISQQAYDIAQKLNFQKGAATALKNIGIGYYYQQKYVEALDYWNQSLKLFEQMEDEVGVSNLLNNIGAVYMDQGDDVRALEYCFQALKVAEKIQDKERIMACLANVASIYHNKNDPGQSTTY